MFELQSRIEITNYILNKFISLSKIVNIESSILGLLVFMIHWFFIAIPLITILVGTINWKFWISICIWISIYIYSSSIFRKLVLIQKYIKKVVKLY